MKLSRTGLLIGVVVLAGLGGAAWWRTGAIAVTLVHPHYGAATELVYGTGFVEAQQPVSVQARITAPVARVLVEEGQRVTRGQPLFLLADDEQRALLAQAAAQRRAAEQTEYRTVTLFRQGWVTRAARDQAVANADVARAAQATAGARQDQLVVRAEIDGVVTRRDVEPGELATPTRVLALLGDPARVRINATIDERDIARVAPGQQALMSTDAMPGRAIPARVAEITPGGDPAQRAFRVRLLPASAANLPLGLSLEVNIVTRRKDRALLVPASAVSAGAVWVVRDGRAHRQEVRTGIAGGEAVEVLAGLSATDSLVDKPPEGLAEGRKVKGQAARGAR
ncbi:efflux RND transporter periplasmic adaptor subunit [Novosphingobium bradum]|uniref:Efflux RND transporter periplasmic adaptor subunit n=1 Tax=Novosphingobium bradum TaxID=1737444 RepID=A0ABV7IQ87_9SPHN